MPLVQTDVPDRLLYADYPAENAKTQTKMKVVAHRMSHVCDNFNLTISTKSTEIVHQPARGKPYRKPARTVNGQKLENI